MERLNYFNPYESKHEDQLTRAYLVLLKHSFHAFFAFFEYCRSELKLEQQEQQISLLEYIENDWIIDTQRGNPEINTDYLLSILITDEKIEYDGTITPSDREARYDGIITFGNKLTLIIENKLEANNVWREQLNPSKRNLSEDIKIYEKPAILEWKEIIKHLNSLLSISTISGYEKIMINDFLAFVDEEFRCLNPYDNFSLCKNNNTLLKRRIENILKSIVCDPIVVKYHRGWGYYIDAQFDEIKEIGLILRGKGDDWELDLCLYFGDSQSRAKNFYNSNPDISKIKEKDGWNLKNNFHVSFMSSNLVWFESSMKIEDYIKYWIEKIDLIYQRKENEVNAFMESLNSNGVITYDTNEQNNMNEKYFKTKMQTLNICPGFAMIYNISSKKAMEQDEKGELAKNISERIKEGLSIVNLDWKTILK